MPHLGPTELLILLAVALLIFGGRKLPELGMQLGEWLREGRLAEPPRNAALALLERERLECFAWLCSSRPALRQVAVRRLLRSKQPPRFPEMPELAARE